MRKRILITGVAGLIGSNLARRLLKEDALVIGMDNFYSSDRSNLDGLLKHGNFRFMEHDVTEPFFVQADEIYHLACPASPVYYQKDPVYTIKTAFYGALNALENAQKSEAKVLLASTSEVYGDPAMHPQRESYWGNVNPIGLRSCYDEGKRAAETLFQDYHREYGVDIRIARIFNTYGEGMHPNDGRVISNFVVQALAGNPITVYGTGNQTRSFCYVSDTVDGLIRLMQRADLSTPVNLGNPQEITINRLAETVLSQMETESFIEFCPLPADDPVRRCPDVWKAKNLLAWEPRIDFMEGIKRTITYFREKNNEDNLLD